MCYTQKGLDFGKKPQIAADLHSNRFFGEFGFDMFDLTTGPADRVGLATVFQIPEIILDEDEDRGAFGLGSEMKKKSKRARIPQEFPGNKRRRQLFSWAGSKIRSAAEAITYEKHRR